MLAAYKGGLSVTDIHNMTYKELVLLREARGTALEAERKAMEEQRMKSEKEVK